MSTLNKEAILSAEDLPTEVVATPEWGGSVIVKTMTARQRDQFEVSVLVAGKVDAENIRAKLLVATLVDEAGNQLFTAEDVEALGKKSAAVVDRIFAIAQRMNGLSAADVDQIAKK